MTYKYIPLNEVAKFRRELRKLFKSGRLKARRTYYDYYDSCHAPVETPNAEWRKASELLEEKDFKAGGPSVIILGNGRYGLFNGYSKYEIELA